MSPPTPPDTAPVHKVSVAVAITARPPIDWVDSVAPSSVAHCLMSRVGNCPPAWTTASPLMYAWVSFFSWLTTTLPPTPMVPEPPMEPT